MTVDTRGSAPADGEREPELEHRLDDEADPAEVTLFCPEPDRMTTEWITVDIGDAVRLSERV